MVHLRRRMTPEYSLLLVCHDHLSNKNSPCISVFFTLIFASFVTFLSFHADLCFMYVLFAPSIWFILCSCVWFIHCFPCVVELIHFQSWVNKHQSFEAEKVVNFLFLSKSCVSCSSPRIHLCPQFDPFLSDSILQLFLLLSHTSFRFNCLLFPPFFHHVLDRIHLPEAAPNLLLFLYSLFFSIITWSASLLDVVSLSLVLFPVDERQSGDILFILFYCTFFSLPFLSLGFLLNFFNNSCLVVSFYTHRLTHLLCLSGDGPFL